MKLSKLIIATLQPPLHQAQKIYWDEELPGFGLRITKANARAWVVQLRLQGRSVRRTVAKVSVCSPEQARQQAKKILSQARLGMNPFAQPIVVSLQQAVADYLAAHQERLKAVTIKDYQRVMRVYFADWLSQPVTALSGQGVVQRHELLRQRHGPAQANLGMRYLSAVLQWVCCLYEDGAGQPLLPRNPVRVLSALKRWYPVARRQRVIRVGELARWYAAVMGLRSVRAVDNLETMRDCLLLMMFTGLRVGEARQLRWSEINFADRTLLIAEPKNRQPHVLPWSDYVESLLRRRYQERSSAYVFASTRREGAIVNLSKAIELVVKACQVPFTAHDLRRTFVTIAEQLGFSTYLLKRLVNHKIDSDVTAGYVVFEPERLRAAMQAIAEFILARV